MLHKLKRSHVLREYDAQAERAKRSNELQCPSDDMMIVKKAYRSNSKDSRRNWRYVRLTVLSGPVDTLWYQTLVPFGPRKKASKRLTSMSEIHRQGYPLFAWPIWLCSIFRSNQTRKRIWKAHVILHHAASIGLENSKIDFKAMRICQGKAKDRTT